jgi:hypothetical protein
VAVVPGELTVTLLLEGLGSKVSTEETPREEGEWQIMMGPAHVYCNTLLTLRL